MADIKYRACKSTRPTRLLALIGISVLALCSAAASANPDKVSSSRMSEAWWRERFFEKQAELQHHPVRLIFFGDSIFHSFEWDPEAPVWNRWYGGRAAVNLGFNGDATADVIWRIRHGEIEGLSPLLAVILIGTNDLGKPPAEIAAEIVDLAQTIRDRAAATRILILGILPSGRPKNEQDVGEEVNARLSAQFSSRGATASYQDLSCVFFRGRRLNTDLFREPAVPGRSYPLHPTPRGMDLVAAAIEPLVAAALGDEPRTTSGSMKETDCPPGG